MAAIDKTYGTKRDSAEVLNWLRRHRPKFLRYHYGVDEYDHLEPDVQRPIINTPISADKWLARYCPLPVVLHRLTEVYPQDDKVHKTAKARLAAKEANDGN